MQNLGLREFYILVGIIFILGLNIISALKSYKKEKIKLEKYKINMELELSIENSNILDSIISDTFNEYVLLNLAYKKDYINKEQEEKIVSDVSSLVTERISTVILERLSLYYNPAIIPDIIGKKIYLTVMSYVLDNNKTTS